jgi:hypothetical protein
MQLSAALQDIDKKLKSQPPLSETAEVHFVSEKSFAEALPDLKKTGLCEPLASQVFQSGLFLQLFFKSPQQEIAFFVQTKNANNVLLSLREMVNAKTN